MHASTPSLPLRLLPVLVALACSGGGGGGGGGTGAPVAQAPVPVPAPEPEITWTQVRTAVELEACMEDPDTTHCLLTESIEFTGNQTERFLDLELPDDTLSHLRCADGVAIVWDNADGPPATPVDVVRLSLGRGERVVIEGCRVETRVDGDPEIGHATSVQLLFARHKGVVPASVSDVSIVGGSYRTAYTGASTIALGCNCNGPTRWSIEGVHAEGPIPLDAKGRSFDGSPLPWRVIDSVLTARAYAGTPRCFKQQNDVTFVDLAGTVCAGGQLQFTELVGGAPHTHDLTGLTLVDAPMPAVENGAMISLEGPHALRGTVRVEGAPGAGDPADARSQNLILADGSSGALDLRVEFADCHRVFSFGSPADFALDLRPGGLLSSPFEVELVGPAACPRPPQLFDRQFEPSADFLGGDSQTVNAIQESQVSGFARTSRSESSFRLVDGAVIPDAEAAAAVARKGTGPADSTPRRDTAGDGASAADAPTVAAGAPDDPTRLPRPEPALATAATTRRTSGGAAPAAVPAIPGAWLPGLASALLLAGRRARSRRRIPTAG